MVLLIFGLVIWWGAHVFKRLMPEMRAGLQERLGDGSKGVFACVVLLSVVLMVFGYRAADFVAIYTPPSWATHLNNLLMFGAIALIGMGNSKGRARSWFRHPMLMGFGLWAFAHLLVNGDLASLLLFGGLLAWAVFAVVLINMREPVWERPEPGPAKGDVKLLVITTVLYVVITGVHSWLGPWPFGG